MALPDGLSKEEVEQRFADEPHLIWFWLGSMESLGILVHHREVPLPLEAREGRTPPVPANLGERDWQA